MKSFSLLVLLLFMLVGSASSKTTVEWWQFWTDPKIKPVIEQMVSEFEAVHPDIDIRLTDLTWANGHEKIVIAFASGTGPDIVELGSDWIAQFAVNEHLEELSDYSKIDRSQFDGWSMAEYQGRFYAHPWILGTRVVFANMDLMKKSGMLNPDFMPINLTQLFMLSRNIHKLGPDIYGWGSNTVERHRLYKKFLPFFWSHGAQIFTDDNRHCVISSERAVDALTTYKLFHDSTGYVGTQREIEDAFLDSKIGIIMSGDWLLKRIEQEERNIKVTTFLMPGPQLPGKSFMGGEFLAINAASKHKTEARAFISFITSPENQLRFCKANRSANPSSKAAQQDSYFTSNPQLDTFVRQLRAARHSPVDPDWVYIEQEIERAVEDALFGRRLPATALRQAQIAITKIREKQNSK